MTACFCLVGQAAQTHDPDKTPIYTRDVFVRGPVSGIVPRAPFSRGTAFFSIDFYDAPQGGAEIFSLGGYDFSLFVQDSRFSFDGRLLRLPKYYDMRPILSRRYLYGQFTMRTFLSGNTAQPLPESTRHSFEVRLPRPQDDFPADVGLVLTPAPITAGESLAQSAMPRGRSGPCPMGSKAKQTPNPFKPYICVPEKQEPKIPIEMPSHASAQAEVPPLLRPAESASVLASSLYFEAMRDYGKGSINLATAKLRQASALEPEDTQIREALARMQGETGEHGPPPELRRLPSLEDLQKAYDIYFQALRQYGHGQLEATRRSLIQAKMLDPLNDGLSVALSQIDEEIAGAHP